MKNPVTHFRTNLFALITLSSLLLSVVLPVQRTFSAPAYSGAPDTDTKQQALEAYGKLPLRFELNQGQTDSSVKFLSRGHGYTLFLTESEATVSLQRQPTENGKVQTAVLRMKLVGAQPNLRPQAQDLLVGKINYLIGNDKKQWHSNIPTYRKVSYQEAWKGIDMVWHGRQRELEYDFVVRPGGDVSQIRLAFEGAQNLRLETSGSLVAQTDAGEVKQQAPVIYQDSERGRQIIQGNYVLRSSNEIGFEVGDYDRTKPLVIDPILVYSTYLGGNGSDEAFGIAVDNSGQAYVVGRTGSKNFPLRNAFQSDNVGNVAFVTKLNAAGSDIVYSTFLGDDSGFCHGSDNFLICGTQAQAVAVGTGGEAVVTGAVINEENESTFPVTENAFQDAGIGCLGACGLRDVRIVDAFVTMLKPDGSDFVYSSFFGGSAFTFNPSSGHGVDVGKSVAVDSANRIYIAGITTSNDLPTKNAFQSLSHSSLDEADAFIAVFDPKQEKGNDTLLYSSYLGGHGDDQGLGIAVDNVRNAYIVGTTASDDLKTKSPSSLSPLQDSFQGGGFDGFVAKVGTASSGDASLTYLTYFGGDINDRVESVAVDSAQRAYITGASNSSPNRFPLKNAFDSTQKNGEAFVAKLNADGTALFYCSFLGGDNDNTADDGEEGLGITIDSGGNAYVTGRTTSGTTFPVGPVAPPFAGTTAGTAFIAKIAATVSSTTPAKLLYSTTFGGKTTKAEAIALDPKGNVYIAGSAGTDLPTTPGAFQRKPLGNGDGFASKFSTTFNDTIGVFRPSNNGFLLRNSNTAGPADISIGFGIAGDLPITGDWDGNGVDDVGIFRPSTGQFQLRLPSGRTFIVINLNNFGQNGDLPVAGDWNFDGIDTVGVFRPSTGQWLLTNGPNTNNTTPPVNFQFAFGQNDDVPIVGDWNGDGFDTPGLFRSGVAQFILSNGFQGTTDITPFTFGALGTKPLAGDWDGDGVATIGVFNPGTGIMSLNNTNTSGNGVGDLVFSFGLNGDSPLAGDWDGTPEVPTN
ncbi:MAG TPA: SBBP repeat-containing protein [Pyrinomonadaceae bacterium]|jgi:hypothetical protein|nr:SBBP repeat-containing protein [Pyrinomonadaceae bacterium]